MRFYDQFSFEFLLKEILMKVIIIATCELQIFLHYLSMSFKLTIF